MSLLYLSQEILLLIIGELRYANDLAAISKLCQTSNGVCARVQPELFRQVPNGVTLAVCGYLCMGTTWSLLCASYRLLLNGLTVEQCGLRDVPGLPDSLERLELIRCDRPVYIFLASLISKSKSGSVISEMRQDMRDVERLRKGPKLDPRDRAYFQAE